MKIIYNSHLVPKGFAAIALWPFIIFKNKQVNTPERLNHEKIHLRQQIEMLLIFFYIFYGLNYLLNKIKGIDKPYKNIIFEKEAKKNEKQLSYLNNRPFWNWTNY